MAEPRDRSDGPREEGDPVIATADSADNRRRQRDPTAAPPAARVRDDDLEPHEGLRYIAKLFKALALLLIFMLIAEVVLGLQQDGVPALGMLLVEATRLIVFAGFLWAAGDLAVLLIESNHDLRAARILLGRLNGRMERLVSSDDDAASSGRAPGPADPAADPRAGRTQPPPRRLGG
jgi:hypothetical protein